MDIPELLTIDSLLEYLGDCGLFQIIIVIILHGSIVAAPWSMMFMAYGNYNPGWKCQDNATDPWTPLSNTTATDVNSLDADTDQSCEAYARCAQVVYSNSSSTIVTEWDLACDGTWIMSTMISLQMAGVLIGALMAGQLNIHIGRRTTHYGTMALHATFNVLASFSVNWHMFTVFRFFLGITCGSLMLCAFVYPMEFITNRCRGVVAALPFSNTGSLTFSLLAMLLRDWRYLHRATALLTAVLILPVFWAPDSMRWLAVKNKIKKAERVGLKIAKTNRKPPASMDVFKVIAETERKIEEEKPHFTILDLYRHGLLRKTLIVTLAWLTNTIIYYAFIFNVQSFSGNFFINLMLFSAISIISLPFVPLLTNTIGRKWGIISLMGLASIACVLLVGLNFMTADIDKGLARLLIILIITIFIDAEWAIVQLSCVELYPTVLRSLSYSHASSVARIGGMVAPFLIPRDESTAYISQIIMLVLMVFTCFCLFLLPETKGQHLEETIQLKGKRNEIVET